MKGEFCIYERDVFCQEGECLRCEIRKRNSMSSLFVSDGLDMLRCACENDGKKLSREWEIPGCNIQRLCSLQTKEACLA